MANGPKCLQCRGRAGFPATTKSHCYASPEATFSSPKSLPAFPPPVVTWLLLISVCGGLFVGGVFYLSHSDDCGQFGVSGGSGCVACSSERGAMRIP